MRIILYRLNSFKNIFLNEETKSILVKLQKDYCPVRAINLFNSENL